MVTNPSMLPETVLCFTDTEVAHLRRRPHVGPCAGRLGRTREPLPRETGSTSATRLPPGGHGREQARHPGQDAVTETPRLRLSHVRAGLRLCDLFSGRILT